MNIMKSKNRNLFKVLRSGINTTYQDLGRDNLYHIGIPFSGVMDKRNFQLLNSILQNNYNSPVIEFAYQGPHLKYFGDEIFFCISGNVSFKIITKEGSIDGNCYQCYSLKNGDEIDIQSTNKSVYGYLSVNGTFDIDYYWGSCSINTQANIGPNNGKKFSNDLEIEIININNSFNKRKLDYLGGTIEHIRVIKGTNFDYFSNSSKSKFFKENFKVTKLSDRMGMRLKGPKIENIIDPNIKSEGLVKGVIQITSDGDPIIMLSDHGTIGGYPKIATVISADYDRLVQLTPGSNIKFKDVSLEDAEILYKLYNMETDNLISQIK